MSWNWAYFWDSVPQLLEAFVTTLLATALTSLFALTLGLPIAFAERIRLHNVVGRLVSLLAEFIRRTPVLIQLYFVFYAGPSIGVTLPALTAGVLTLSIHYATYTAQSYRAGIDAVPNGQWDAAMALHMPRTKVWTKVVFPQVLPAILAAQGNWVLVIFKATALLSTITVVELVGASQQIGSEHLSYLEPTILIGIFFLGVSYPASVLLRLYERRISRYRRG